MHLFTPRTLFLSLLLLLLETFLLGWPVSMGFTLRRFRILELARGGLVTLIVVLLLVHLVSTLGVVTLFVLWTLMLRPCFVPWSPGHF